MSQQVSPLPGERASPLLEQPASPLQRAVERWLIDGRARGHSIRTLGNRRHMLQKFEWWLVNEAEQPPAVSSITPAAIRAFLVYLREDHGNPRFGSRIANTTRPVRPSTSHTYYRCLRTFTNWLQEEGEIESSPLKNVKAPRVPNDQVQPFTAEQVQALVDQARRNRLSGDRDVAIILLLLDTGMRAAELCGLYVEDFDKDHNALVVVGKGNKKRRLFLGVSARRALFRYVMNRDGLSKRDPLFVGKKGLTPGARMTPSGVFQVVQRHGLAAGIQGAGCHRLRHTFAVSFLRSGGNLFELQQLMGHTDLTVLRRYVALAESDLEASHRKASPADRLGIR